MSYILIVIKLIIFLLSNMGYWEYYRKKLRINEYFAPAFTVAVQITVLFGAGILNILQIAAYLLWGIGLLLFVFGLYKNGTACYKKYAESGFIWLYFMLVVIMIAVKGRVFTHYDNFSHWALVVQEMIETNMYPNFSNTLISFQSYPLGSASYIYYFCNIVDKSESIQMLAQAYMMLTCIVSLFVFVRRHKKLSCINLVLLTNFIFSLEISIYDLLVDTLLPLVGVTSILFTYYACNAKSENDEGKDAHRLVLCTIPFTCMLVQIKNSGVYFVAICCVILIAVYIVNKMIGLIKQKAIHTKN